MQKSSRNTLNKKLIRLIKSIKITIQGSSTQLKQFKKGN